MIVNGERLDTRPQLTMVSAGRYAKGKGRDPRS